MSTASPTGVEAADGNTTGEVLPTGRRARTSSVQQSRVDHFTGTFTVNAITLRWVVRELSEAQTNELPVL